MSSGLEDGQAKASATRTWTRRWKDAHHGRRFTIFDGGKVDKKGLLAVKVSLARDKREKSLPKGILLRHFWMAFLSFGHVNRKVFHE